MYTVFIACFVGLLVALKYSSIRKRKGDRFDLSDQIFLSVISVVCFGFLASLIVLRWNSTNTTRVEVKRETLLAFRNSDSLSGNFYLGCGSFESTDYYRYFRKVGENGIQLQRMEVSDDVIVIEDMPDGQAYLVQTRNQMKKSSPWLLETTNIGYKWEFHIPKGTLKREFTLK